MLGGGDADVHRWLMEHGAYSGTIGNVSDMFSQRDRTIEKQIKKVSETERETETETETEREKLKKK